jgi:hypothetical protein
MDREPRCQGAAAVSPASSEELELHLRLLNGDVAASDDLFRRYAGDLIDDLSRRYDRIAAYNAGLVSSAVTDAVFGYIADPAKYRPGKKNLRGYLCMSAAGDLLNLWRRVPGPERAGSVKSLDEMIERGAELECDAVAQTQELDVYGSPVNAICRAWRHLLEWAPDSSPTGLVRILDEIVALEPESGNSIVRAILDLDGEGFGLHVLLSLWQRVRLLVPDGRERRTFVLMLCGVRETGLYADVLQIDHLPLSEQQREVKRTKDRIRKRLRRADWSGFVGKER